MPLAEILTAIRDEADALVSKAAASSDEQVASILVRAEQAAEEEHRRWAVSREQDAALAVARIINRARLEAERTLRASREELYEEAVRGLERRLEGIRARPDYPELLGRLLTEALEVLPDATIVKVDPSDVDLARRLVHEVGVPCTVEGSITSWGGLDVATGDGRVVGNTLEARLEKAQPELRRLSVSTIPELGGGG